MTDLKRRALLGDAEAQRECTWEDIVLPCPFCGTQPQIMFEGPYENTRGFYGSWFVQCTKCGTIKQGSHDHFTFCKETGEFVRNGNSKKEAIEKWNTRPAPPIGRCGECGAYTSEGPGLGCCSDGTGKTDDGFCDCFYPKGGADNA